MFEWGKYAISIIATIVLLILEATITYACAALENLPETELKNRMDEGEERAGSLWELRQKMEQCSNFMLLVTNTLNLAIGFFYSKRILHWSLLAASYTGEGQINLIFQKLFQLIGMILLVLVVTIFSSALPRKMAVHQSENKAYRYRKIITIFITVFQGFSFAIEYTLNGIFLLSGRKASDYEDNVTEDEIISIVNEGLEQGILEGTEVEMISNIIEMDEKEVRDIMTRRTQIVALDGGLSIEEAMQKMLGNSYSRVPVYDGDIDNIFGIVFWKDITKYYIQKKNIKAPLKSISKKAYHVPDTQKINVLFKEMQLKKIHMAIAVDEYGQTAGIVAMEDVLEEIVGNIFDEYDVTERMIIKQSNHKYYMRGLAPLEEVAKELKLNMKEELEDYDTLNGFLISKLGHIPKEKEKVNIIYKGYEFRVVDVKDRMIKFVRVHKEHEKKNRDL